MWKYRFLVPFLLFLSHCSPQIDNGLGGDTEDIAAEPISDDGDDSSTEEDENSDSTGVDEVEDVPPPDPICNNGILEKGEECDDGNLLPDDGCNAACEIENNFACPTPGADCVQIVVCGNGRIEGEETCDDQNLQSNDGCSVDCQLESGWSCDTVGTACSAAQCGDGVKAGLEACDDGNNISSDGCDSGCQLEAGFFCDAPGVPCGQTICGDGIVQGSEECDDQNNDVGDGCAPGCVREAQCENGVCLANCGDGFVFSPEQCDDGNLLPGDGCDANCEVEIGFACTSPIAGNPAQIVLPVTVRDFIAACDVDPGDRRLADDEPGAIAPYGHRDFGCFVGSGATLGMVENTLAPDGKPVRVANNQTFSDEAFDLWYRNNDSYNRSVAKTFVLDNVGNGAYQLDTNSLFPITGDGFDNEVCQGSPCEKTYTEFHGTGDQNFHFTTETRWWFQYEGDEQLDFSGDDDVWVFINNRLAVDIGGLHPRVNDSVDLSDPSVQSNLGLTLGGIYEAVLFHAERHVTASQYRLTLTNFGRSPSQCTDSCGDGIRSALESCDLGTANGLGDGSDYGGCALDCTPEPSCGDGVVDASFGEICDDGLNLGGNASSCAPGCQSLGAFCGDGVVQVNDGEECDDGNTNNLDGCDKDCKFESVVE